MIDVIIPVKERPEASIPVLSLLSLPKLVAKIILVDASLDGREGRAIAELCGSSSRVDVVRLPMTEFSKSACLNAGLRSSSAELVMVSDAEILWFSSTISAMAEQASAGDAFCHVADVEETDTETGAGPRRRLCFRMIAERASATPVAEIAREASAAGALRPGCGLVMARRDAWFEIGGYVEDFTGWGWEDQDLLMRAGLSGFHLPAVGRVVHVTHGDDRRNLPGGTAPEASRNKNILISMARINAGRLYGALRNEPRRPTSGARVVISDEGLREELERNPA